MKELPKPIADVVIAQMNELEAKDSSNMLCIVQHHSHRHIVHMVLVNILRRSSDNKKVWLVTMEIIIIITCVDAVFGFKRLVPHS